MTAGSDLSDDCAVVFGSGAAGDAPGNNLGRKRIDLGAPSPWRSARPIGNQNTKGYL
jgi:hypothetical protein